MARRRCIESEGVTLLELMFAVAIFAVAVGVTAQSLVSFYATMDLQSQRVIAINHCRGILNTMRTTRDAHPNSAATPSNFQTSVLAQYPNNTQLQGPTTLRNAKVKIMYEQAVTTANPLVPTVRIQWTDLRGHTATASITSALTDL